MSDPTSLPAAVVADTIIRTVELGMTITDAAVDGEATVGSAICSPTGSAGQYSAGHSGDT